MNVLALGLPPATARPQDIARYETAEIKMMWEFHAAGVVRVIYTCPAWTCVVAVIDCRDLSEAEGHFQNLPLVKAGLMAYSFVSLQPIPGFSEMYARFGLPIPDWWPE